MSRYVREKQKVGKRNVARAKAEWAADYCMRCLGTATGWFKFESTDGMEGGTLPICEDCNRRFEKMTTPALQYMFVQGMIRTVEAYEEAGGEAGAAH